MVSFRYFQWAVQEVSIGKLISISFFSGLFISAFLNTAITGFKKNTFKEIISSQYFDERENQFLSDRYISGTCPTCGYEDAYGDQCESCGKTLSPLDLKNPKSTLSGNSPILKETKNLF